MIGTFISIASFSTPYKVQRAINVICRNLVNCTDGGIIVTATNITQQAPIYQNHRNVVITGNVVAGAVHPVIIGSATGVTLKSNIIVDGCCYPYVQEVRLRRELLQQYASRASGKRP